ERYPVNLLRAQPARSNPMGKNQREFKASEVLEWWRTGSPIIRVETATDVLPGGLSAAMSPMMVNWNASPRGHGPNDFYLVHNVNVASNPIEGTTLLATVRVPSAGVESVQFVMVLTKVGKRKTDAGHAQLRFVFKEASRPVVVDRDGKPVAHNAELGDLVLSWEAWRPPVTGFDPVAGLDPKTYALTLRCFNGAVRCLSDAILDRPWSCYPLKLPDVPHAADELLYVSLLLGDAVARQTIHSILDKRIEQGRNTPGDYRETEAEEWAELKALSEQQEIPENPIGDILGGKVSYHLLLRSCITMALTSIDWANTRIHRRANLGDPKRIRIAPESFPRFLDDLALSRRRSALVRIPAALHWLVKNQAVIPGKSFELLDEVGLLERKEGRIVRWDYENRVESPYGKPSEHLIY
ncbi:MAG: hypothetical protein JSW50_08970, partial [Candidatus Latescibacterota bacterium]